MENSSVPLYQQDSMRQAWATVCQHNYPSSEGYSSLSPASSTDSSGLSPPYTGYQTSQDAFGNISIPASQPMDLNIQPSEKKIKKMKGKLPFTQRQSASEREKMRMRNLSKALQNLRRYLPPSVAPIDKTLTKIETLQLTIRYISYLSAQLGLSKEVLEQRRQTFKQRTKCAQSISCYIDTSPSLCSKPVKENMSLMASKEHKSSTSSTAVRSQCQNTRKSCQMPYDFPQCSELQVRPLQNYPVTFAALSQPSNDHVTSHPQMAANEWRSFATTSLCDPDIIGMALRQEGSRDFISIEVLN
ncbi:uncharacterized protein LOC143774909 [Ranitomeya variabilis]|uniref:uncharacterized protein LOC143774909 n=1 Tax=Ranitomeya variabilis TaxID=490064 RepID=UPI0040577C01